MDPSVEQLEAEIDRKREHLGADLHELEGKVESVMDWRRQYRAHTLPVLSIAFASGVALALMGHDHHQTRSIASDNGRTGPIQDAWNDIRRALVTVAATRLADYVRERLP
jgi:hypothetical protein